MRQRPGTTRKSIQRRYGEKPVDSMCVSNFDAQPGWRSIYLLLSYCTFRRESARSTHSPRHVEAVHSLTEGTFQARPMGCQAGVSQHNEGLAPVQAWGRSTCPTTPNRPLLFFITKTIQGVGCLSAYLFYGADERTRLRSLPCCRSGRGLCSVAAGSRAHPGFAGSFGTSAPRRIPREQKQFCSLVDSTPSRPLPPAQNGRHQST